jgi:hypothetical protein
MRTFLELSFADSKTEQIPCFLVVSGQILACMKQNYPPAFEQTEFCATEQYP